MQQEEEKFWTINISDHRHSQEGGPTEVTLGCQAPSAREGTVAARTGSGTHRGIHSPWPQPLLPAHPAHPPSPPGSKQNSLSRFLIQACTELTVIIGRCAAGFWVSIHQGLMKTGCCAQPVFSLGSEKLQLSMTRGEVCGCSCPGQTRIPEQSWRKRPLWPTINSLLGERGGNSP